MAKKFKDYYNLAYARLISSKIQQVRPDFPSEKFCAHTGRSIRGKEFGARVEVFALALKESLGGSYRENLELFFEILGPPLKTHTGMFTEGWWLWPIGRYIEREAPKNPKNLALSLRFIEELTRRFTGEFAIRPLLEQKPERVLRQMQKWTGHSCVHVRRLSSEGIRVHLPWAKKLDLYPSYQAECLDVLESLIAAPEKFVQKSVGNNINDLYRAHPMIAESFVERWRNSADKHTQWILRHGQRSLTKGKS